MPITLTPDDATATFDDVTARLELDYRVNDDLLVFASYNRGSKSGGFSFSTGTPFADFPPVTPLGTDAQFLNGIPFDPEVAERLRGRLQVDDRRDDHLQRERLLLRLRGLPGVRAARRQPDGHQPACDGLRPRGGDQLASRGRPDAAARRLGARARTSRTSSSRTASRRWSTTCRRRPSFSGNALARYEFELGGGLASIQADVQYTDDFCFTVLCAPVEKEKGYTVLNARIGYGAQDGRWEVAVFGDNLTEEEYRVYAFDSSLFAGVVAGVYGKPRTYGVRAIYRFGGAY